MTAAMITMQKWQDEYLTLLARVEEPVVKFAGKAAESVAEYVPETPHWAFLGEIPTMTEFVDSQLKFRKRVVDEQAAFVRKMMKALHPLMLLEQPAPAVKRVATKVAAPVRKARAKAA